MSMVTTDSLLVPARSPAGLARMLNPRSVAVIGASEKPGAVGSAVVRNLIEGAFRGDILCVNPNRDRVFGRPTCPRIGDARGPIDLAVVCTPAVTVPAVVRECGEAGVGGIVLISAGFREAGSAGAALEKSLRTELDRYPHMRAIGPNSVGMMIPAIGLNASFARGTPAPGGLALLSQSGALCTAILGWAEDEGLGFSHFISVGNMLDVGFGDLLDELADRAEVEAVVLYIEAVTEAPRFIAAARRCVARKPVIAFKAGRYEAGARAAASHTGAMAGEDAVYDAAFAETGITRVSRLDDLLATAELLGRHHELRPGGRRLAIVSNAGGPAVIAADAIVSGKGELAKLSQETIAALSGILPAHWPHANPVDVIGDASAQRIAAAVQVVLGDTSVDAALVIVTPQAMTDMAETARAVASVCGGAAKPVLAVWMGGTLARGGGGILQAAGIPTYETPEPAVEAFLHLATYACRDRATTPTSPPCAGAARATARLEHSAEPLPARRSGLLTAAESKRLLAGYGVPVVEPVTARTGDEAVAAAGRLGYPVAVKVLSPHISHKTDVGGVRLDVARAEDVAAAFNDIRFSLARSSPGAYFDGVTVERMMDRSTGVEVIVGVKRDATFGPVVLVGAGGTTAEVIGDQAIGLAPITEERARTLVGRLRISPLLGPFRGRPALDTAALARVIVAISRLAVERPSILEAEANPVLVMPSGVVALDARVILRSGGGATPLVANGK